MDLNSFAFSSLCNEGCQSRTKQMNIIKVMGFLIVQDRDRYLYICTTNNTPVHQKTCMFTKQHTFKLNNTCLPNNTSVHQTTHLYTKHTCTPNNTPVHKPTHLYTKHQHQDTCTPNNTPVQRSSFVRSHGYKSTKDISANTAGVCWFEHDRLHQLHWLDWLQSVDTRNEVVIHILIQLSGSLQSTVIGEISRQVCISCGCEHYTYVCISFYEKSTILVLWCISGLNM